VGGLWSWMEGEGVEEWDVGCRGDV
jgi:hypothetical protein